MIKLLNSGNVPADHINFVKKQIFILHRRWLGSEHRITSSALLLLMTSSRTHDDIRMMALSGTRNICTDEHKFILEQIMRRRIINWDNGHNGLFITDGKVEQHADYIAVPQSQRDGERIQ